MKYFSALIKPASSLCNMRCKYCFYCDVSNNREVFNYGIMQRATSENLIRRIFEYASEGTNITLAFQGGEPTLAGIEYFEHITEFAEKLNEKRFRLSYAIQTNGYLIDDRWSEFLGSRNFLAGLSLDGQPRLHDLYRTDSQQNGTHTKVMNAAKLFTKHGVKFNILSVVTAQTAKHPVQTYSWFKKQGFHYLQFIPCLEPLNSTAVQNSDRYALTPKLYADFLKKLFSAWKADYDSGNYTSIRMFDNLAGMLNGKPPEQCGMSGFCTPQFVVEADGSVYPCDFYVLDKYRSGNVNTDTIDVISRSEAMKDFAAHTEPLNELCDTCRYYRLCGGGCRRYREFYNSVKNYCPYKEFLEFALTVL